MQFGSCFLFLEAYLREGQFGLKRGCVTLSVCCTAGGEHASTLPEVGQSGYGAATREGVEAELKSLKSEWEVPAGTTRDKVGMNWSERWCRHGTWTNCGIEISSIVEWLSQSIAVSACSVLGGTCSVEQIMRQPLPMGQSCGVCSAV